MRQSHLDGPDDTLQVLQHFVVPETNDLKTEPVEFLGSILIVLASFRMMTAIQLHDQASFQTNEISNVGTEPKLPLELLP